MTVIGYTTGVFDLFHIGHLNIIKGAKSLCDYLIVGVTTDELSQQAKGKIPVICYKERMEIVQSIKCVDRVVPQDTMDKMAAWKQYNFNKMFVGSDWLGTASWNEYEQQFGRVGVKIVYLPHTDGVSSTLIKEVLLKLQGGDNYQLP